MRCTVDGLEAQRPLLGLAKNDRAGAAVAFAAAFLVPVQPKSSRSTSSRCGGWYIAQRHDLAAADELNGLTQGWDISIGTLVAWFEQNMKYQTLLDTSGLNASGLVMVAQLAGLRMTDATGSILHAGPGCQRPPRARGITNAIRRWSPTAKSH